jgi:cation:H+ antiporter
LIGGIVGLVLGTELVVRGAVDIANHFKLSRVFIGLAILAIGTDLPEFVIAITAALNKLKGIETSGIILGDAIGSSFSQIGFVLGILGITGYVILTKEQIKIDGLVMLSSVVLLFLVGYDGTITQLEGLVLVLVYLIYYVSLYRRENTDEKIKRTPAFYPVWSFVLLVSGLAIVIYTSNVVVDNIVALAGRWGVSQVVIAILITGFGTSLPELAVSLGALIKGEGGLSVGNLVGSNIFDILVPVGTGAIISGLTISRNMLFFDIPALFVLSVVVLLFFFRIKGIQRKEAIIIFLLYAFYVLLKIAGY